MILDVKNKKILTIVFSLLIVFILGFIFIQNAFLKPTKLNYFIASKIYKTPANNAFTDENFYKCVVDAYNSKNNTSLPYTTNLSDEQLAEITSLNCGGGNEDNQKIISTSGIEKITSLMVLYIHNNLLNELDISHNTKLTELYAYDSLLTSLDTSHNPLLTKIVLGDYHHVGFTQDGYLTLSYVNSDINDNKISNLDVSHNPLLTYLDLNGIGLTDLDISNNPSLVYLDVSYNQLTDLDVTQSPSLTNLYVVSNQLINLDITGVNNLKYLVVLKNKLTSLDLSHNSSLISIVATTNKLTSLDLSSNSSLTQLYVSDNQLTTLDVSDSPFLKGLNAGNNRLTGLNVSNNAKLKQLSVENNQLTTLDVSNSPSLERLNVQSNKLTSLDLSSNSSLTQLNVDGNQLTTLDVSNSPSLEELYVQSNKLTSLDISKNVELKYLSLAGNEIVDLNLIQNVNLLGISTDISNFDKLDLSKNVKLHRINFLNGYFKSEFAIYVNEFYEIPETNSPIILPTVLDYYFSEAHYAGTRTCHLYNGECVFTPTYNMLIESNKIKLLEPCKTNVVANYKIEKESNEISEYDVRYTVYSIEATSDKYEINAEEGYIYTKTDTDENTILNNINLNYGDASIEDNKLLIKYNEELIKSFDIVNVSSDVYKITDNYLYYENGNMMSSNIKLTNATYTEIDDSQHNKKMSIKYNGKEIDQLDFVTYYSNKYDLTKDYIFSEEELNLDLINTTNLIKEVIDNKLIIRYNDEIFKNIDIIKVESSKYNLSKNYIYTGTSNLDLNDINVINGQKIVEKDKLKIKYNEDLLKEYSIYSINFGEYKEYDRLLILPEDITYEELTNNITTNGVTYKIFNGESEVTEGNLSEGMIIKIYYRDEVIDEYEITNEYLELDESLNIDNETNIIERLSRNMKLKDFILLINTSGSIEVRNNNNELLSEDSIIGTGNKVKITLNNRNIEYTLSVKGDVTGNGQAKMADVMKIATHIIEGNVIEGEAFEKAADITGDGKIKMNDVMKLATFIIEGGEL